MSLPLSLHSVINLYIEPPTLALTDCPLTNPSHSFDDVWWFNPCQAVMVLFEQGTRTRSPGAHSVRRAEQKKVRTCPGPGRHNSGHHVFVLDLSRPPSLVQTNGR
ncbi:hypothetical protein PoB_007101800 [Plakobranchus ocellatus]|uniref:Uncharacterized protein n=1 Tax=Plakobranchus ocellatus TaxID=259542 RepID=A0AAV4DKB3_9GAST|nr:hypothetical protein PoB_007101800 [Plakobranchus ocellatus]